VLGVDPAADVALLQIKHVSGLAMVTIGDSSALEFGQEMVAIGNALGQGGLPTVTAGTVTAVGRSITVGDDHGGTEHLTGMIQTDAKISPGDSGGPLVNSSGQVVGMITAGGHGDASGAASKVGFAITSNAALRIVNLIRAGHASSSIILGEVGYLGVEARDLDAQTASHLGLETTSGALVVATVPGSPAASVGIPKYAAITRVDGIKISSAAALGSALHIHGPGERVKITRVSPSGSQTDPHRRSRPLTREGQALRASSRGAGHHPPRQ
jgi:S1-C subfamily serine protease